MHLNKLLCVLGKISVTKSSRINKWFCKRLFFENLQEPKWAHPQLALNLDLKHCSSFGAVTSFRGINLLKYQKNLVYIYRFISKIKLPGMPKTTNAM